MYKISEMYIFKTSNCRIMMFCFVLFFFFFFCITEIGVFVILALHFQKFLSDPMDDYHKKSFATDCNDHQLKQSKSNLQLL